MCIYTVKYRRKKEREKMGDNHICASFLASFLPANESRQEIKTFLSHQFHAVRASDTEPCFLAQCFFRHESFLDCLVFNGSFQTRSPQDFRFILEQRPAWSALFRQVSALQKTFAFEHIIVTGTNLEELFLGFARKARVEAKLAIND